MYFFLFLGAARLGFFPLGRLQCAQNFPSVGLASPHEYNFLSTCFKGFCY